jgi:hypothetical protein
MRWGARNAEHTKYHGIKRVARQEQVLSLGCRGSARYPHPKGGRRCRWGVRLNFDADTECGEVASRCPCETRRRHRVRSEPRR